MQFFNKSRTSLQISLFKLYLTALKFTVNEKTFRQKWEMRVGSKEKNYEKLQMVWFFIVEL